MGKLTDENIKNLKKRILDSLKVSNLKEINKKLATVKDSILIAGVGGSSVVCEFAKKIFEEKNKCFTRVSDPRDLNYSNVKIFKNIMAISYSGKNFGVKLSFENDANKYLLTNNKTKHTGVTSIVYDNTIEKEKSFVSLAATLMPITILLNYYLNNKKTPNIINDAFDNVQSLELPTKKNITVIYGNESIMSARFIESTFIEAGIANIMLCTKYNYCHGQTTLPYHSKSEDLIYFKTKDTELDKLILKEAESLYDNITVIECEYQDNIITDFYLLIQSIFFCYNVSKKYKKDLSKVKYAPAVKNLYYFEGSV